MNHGHEMPAYGLWTLVIINSAIFIIFAFSFFKPKTRRDWRTFGSFSAFIVALFVEMYGFPLTIYLLSGWLAQRFPGIDPLNHDFGHLWYTLLGFEGDPHRNPIHIASNVLIVAGFFVGRVERPFFARRGPEKLATTGPYAAIGFIPSTWGSSSCSALQWLTLVTLVMFPILVVVYVRLAHREEREVRTDFGAVWDEYAARTPGFIPWTRGQQRRIDGERNGHVAEERR